MACFFFNCVIDLYQKLSLFTDDVPNEKVLTNFLLINFFFQKKDGGADTRGRAEQDGRVKSFAGILAGGVALRRLLVTAPDAGPPRRRYRSRRGPTAPAVSRSLPRLVPLPRLISRGQSPKKTPSKNRPPRASFPRIETFCRAEHKGRTIPAHTVK